MWYKLSVKKRPQVDVRWCYITIYAYYARNPFGATLYTFNISCNLINNNFCCSRNSDGNRLKSLKRYICNWKFFCLCVYEDRILFDEWVSQFEIDIVKSFRCVLYWNVEFNKFALVFKIGWKCMPYTKKNLCQSSSVQCEYIHHVNIGCAFVINWIEFHVFCVTKSNTERYQRSACFFDLNKQIRSDKTSSIVNSIHLIIIFIFMQNDYVFCYHLLIRFKAIQITH